MLKEIAIADAYGAGFEFASPEKIRNFNTLDHYFEHNLYQFSAKYTDDTQMSIAIAELILSHSEWDDESIASGLVDCFKRDPRRGYSKGFYKLLTTVNSGRELLKKINSSSDRNGAAIRSVPLGFLKDKKKVIFAATKQAAVTHNTKIAIASSCSVALATYFGIHMKGQISDVKRFLTHEGFSDWDYEWNEVVSVSAFDTVSAALSCLNRCDNLKDLLFSCVSLGGDTDSVASIAVGIASCYQEYDKKLPHKLIETLDEDEYGIEFLEQLDRQLLNYAVS
jgi:ADP-ribosylglycohydrolase